MRTIKLIIFSLLPAVILLGGAEIILRAANFRYSDTPIEMQAKTAQREGYAHKFVEYGRLRGAGVNYVKDPYQMWVPGFDYAEGFAKEPASGRAIAS